VRILITTQVFPPEIHISARIVLEMSKALCEAGHQVVVATGFPNHPHGEVFGGYRKRCLFREEIDGVRVVRGWHVTSTSSLIFMRAIAYVSQALGTTVAALFSVRPHLVINFGPPLVGPYLSILLSKMFGARSISVIYDLYPDVAIETGAVKNAAIIRMAKAVERLIYSGSDRIVVLSEGFRETLIGKGVDEEKIRIIPIWMDPSEIHRSTDFGNWRARHDIGTDVFVALYAGTIGIVSGADVMAEVAKKWSEDPSTLFLFVGQGKGKKTVEEKSAGYRNVRFLDFQPREVLSEMLSSADVGIMTILPGRGKTSVPSKVLGYMATEVPILASCDLESDSAKMINNAQCGIIVPPGDAEAISNALRWMSANREQCRTMGENGRRFLEQHHTKAIGTKAFVDIVREYFRPAQRIGEEEWRLKT